jgi:DNA-directed RNA polymerase subunit RPC12/RpoP
LQPGQLDLFDRGRQLEKHETSEASQAIVCPLCGEHDAEWLLRQNEQTVECQMCGTQFPAE